MDTRHKLMNNKLTEENINIVSELLLFNFKLTFHHYCSSEDIYKSFLNCSLMLNFGPQIQYRGFHLNNSDSIYDNNVSC